MRVAVNVVVVYASWFATVIAAASGSAWLAAAASLVAVVLNVVFASNRANDVKLIAVAAVVGLVVETLLMTQGLADYASPGPIAGLPPAWLVLMWMAFATLLNISLAWLKERWLLAAVLGFVGGALAYYAGARLGAMQLGEPLAVSLGAIGTLWAVAFPALLHAARRFDDEPAQTKPQKSGAAE